jgi:hypothetical protein
MKTYLVFKNGIEMTGVIIKAANHNAAEKKAIKQFSNNGQHQISVEYTEI